MGFLKGLFGKGHSTQPDARHDDVAYEYHQSAPVTGAQLKSPPVVTPVGRTTVNGRATAGAAAPQKSPNVLPASKPVAQTAVATNGHSNGNGKLNGQVAAPKTVVATPAATTVQIPVVVKSSDGNGNGTHAPAPVAPTPKPSPAPVGFINLPLTALITALPPELKTKVLKPATGDATVAVSLESVMAQLATGVVKISFGALRECAPQCFAPTANADQTMITVPLGEVLRQINPAQLAKPTNQVRLTAADDITSPFADKGSNANLEVKGTAPARSITPEAATPTPPRQTLGEISKPTAPSANVPLPVRINIPQAPAAAPKPPAPAATPAPVPATPTAPKINGVHSLRMEGTPVAPAPAPATVVTPAPESTPAVSQASLTVALKSLVDAWPEAVKQEILEHNLVSGSVDLPLTLVATQLKSGRVAFKWDLIRSWITPRPGTLTTHGALELELPLRIVAPLFVGLKSADSAKVQRVTADDKIPNFFNTAVKPALAAAPAPAPAAVVESVPQPALVAEPAPVGMTPDAVVKRAAALNGVAGALVALPDGLVVASRLPAGQRGDSLAAFLPQIYAKFDACLKELNMGELNNLNFTAGDVPWRVFRTNSVFFAAFGRAGEILPGDWLAALAGELEKK